jgi:hypothetical protein
MITAFIFFIHFLFALIIFTKKWQEEDLKTGFINLALIAILFSVGWSIAGIIAKLFLEPEGFGIHFNRDTFSLTLLTLGEYFFFRFYYAESKS